jgi:hypothetical protein
MDSGVWSININACGYAVFSFCNSRSALFCLDGLVVVCDGGVGGVVVVGG